MMRRAYMSGDGPQSFIRVSRNKWNEVRGFFVGNVYFDWAWFWTGYGITVVGSFLIVCVVGAITKAGPWLIFFPLVLLVAAGLFWAIVGIVVGLRTWREANERELAREAAERRGR